MTVEIIAFIYSQAINVFETLLWVKGFWKLRDVSETWKGVKKIPRDAYHFFLAIAYVLPFIVTFNFLEVAKGSILVWLLNDLTWHFWSVHPSSWFKWIKDYFNPRSTITLWYARLLFARVRVTPKLMFWITTTRIILLIVLQFIETLAQV